VWTVAKNRATYLKLTLLTIPSILIALLFAEMLVRFYSLAPPVLVIHIDYSEHNDEAPSQTAYKYSSNPFLNYVLKENYRDDDPDYFDRLPATNLHGQRDIERQWEKAPDVRRVLVLGDSVVIGDGIQKLDDTIPRQLEKLIQGEGIEVLNLGVSGYNTRAEVELLKVKGVKYRPDVVILVLTENDFQTQPWLETETKKDVEAGEREAVEKGKRLEVQYRRSATVRSLFAKSHLFRLMCLHMNFFRYREQYLPESKPKQETQNPSDDALTYREHVAKNNVTHGLRILKELAAKHNFNAVIVAWPSFSTEIKNPVFLENSVKFEIEPIAESFGIPTYQVSAYFWKHYQRTMSDKSRTPAECYAPDGMHPSPLGARVAAEAIEVILIDAGYRQNQHRK